ncbi:MAG: ubiquinol-cytochrome c reductase iron-sulfur subunit, partial [Limibacillus sp.]
MAETVHSDHEEGGTRRDFLYLATGAMGAVGVGAVVWPLIDTLNPSADVLALASIDVDLTPIAVGQRITVTWRGKPVFIDHRPAEAIEQARAVDVADLRDPQADEERAIKPEWLILVGVC